MNAEEVQTKFLDYWVNLPLEQKVILLKIAAEFEQANRSRAKK